ncbi:MAG: hypothetical protein KC733_03280 [Candidatus Omnitrophica bacterium]|nr:hypothetical protein [Candidatus Omnitrophota bacterium]
MPDTSVKDQIRKLVELQKIDIEVFKLRKSLKEKPSIIENLKQEFEDKKEKLKNLEEKYKTILVKRKEIELELKGKEDEIAKANAQLSQLKTNKEYTAKISEIENLKADKSISEDKILASYDEADAAGAEIEEEKKNVDQQEKEFLAQKKVLEDEIKVMDDQIKVKESQRKQKLEGVDPNYLNRYEKILNHRDGFAIAPVVNNNICGGCYMNVTSQNINVIKIGQELFQCEFCTRILYIEEDL